MGHFPFVFYLFTCSQDNRILHSIGCCSQIILTVNPLYILFFDDIKVFVQQTQWSSSMYPKSSLACITFDFLYPMWTRKFVLNVLGGNVCLDEKIMASPIIVLIIKASYSIISTHLVSLCNSISDTFQNVGVCGTLSPLLMAVTQKKQNITEELLLSFNNILVNF